MKTTRVISRVLFRNKGVVLLLVFSLSAFYLFSQNTVLKDSADLKYKNAIKGFALPLLWYNAFSIGYERYITKHSLIELVLNSQSMLGEEGGFITDRYIMPGYKYSFASTDKWYKNIWIGGYMVYNFDNELFIGISLGKKIYLSRDKSWFLDIGFGAFHNIFIMYPLFLSCSMTEYYYRYMEYRPIVQFGKKF